MRRPEEAAAGTVKRGLRFHLNSFSLDNQRQALNGFAVNWMKESQNGVP
jgi:hypothetical protein